jgi:hypothetical protein
VVLGEVTSVPATAESTAGLQVPADSQLARVKIVEARDGCRVARLDSWIPVPLVDVESLTRATGSLLRT